MRTSALNMNESRTASKIAKSRIHSPSPSRQAYFFLAAVELMRLAPSPTIVVGAVRSLHFLAVVIAGIPLDVSALAIGELGGYLSRSKIRLSMGSR